MAGHVVDSLGVRESIIAEARKSFYELGYAGTTYAALAKSLDLSPGSLTYHFDSKAEIGSEVHKQYVLELDEMIRDWLMSHYGFYSPLMDFVLQIRTGMKMYDEDEKAFRFYREYAKNDFEKALLSGINPFFAPYLKEEDLNIEQDEPVLFSAAYRSIAMALNIVYFSTEVSTDLLYFTDYKIRTLLSFARIPTEIIEQTIVDSQKYFDEMDIELLPDFRMVARK